MAQGVHECHWLNRRATRRFRRLTVSQVQQATMAPRTKFYILASLALGFVDGAVARLLYPGQMFAPSSFAISMAGLFVIFMWYRADSDNRTFRRTPLLSLGVVGLPIVAIPYYLFRTRGFRHGALSTLVVLLVAIGYSAMGYLGQMAVRAMRT